MKYAVIADVAGQYEALMRLIAKIPSDYEIMIGQTNLCHVNIHNPNCENL